MNFDTIFYAYGGDMSLLSLEDKVLTLHGAARFNFARLVVVSRGSTKPKMLRLAEAQIKYSAWNRLVVHFGSSADTWSAVDLVVGRPELLDPEWLY